VRRPGLIYVNARVAVLVELVEGDMVDELNGGEGGMTKLMWMGGGKKCTDRVASGVVVEGVEGNVLGSGAVMISTGPDGNVNKGSGDTVMVFGRHWHLVRST